jgi:Lipase (class 3)
MSGIAYSPRKMDLFYPARSATFFPAGLPETEAGLCAEMARIAGCRPEPDFQFDRQQIRAVLEPLGFICQFFESVENPNGTATHGLLALHDDLEPGGSLAVLAFRGTDASDPTDLADDAEFLQREWAQGGLVHCGFAKALEPILPTLRPALDKLRGRVLFTGHSLGAAMATLLATIRRPDFLYTFGSPRVGNAQFVSTLNSLYNRRFVNCCDIVARIPPESLLGEINYAHYGVPYYIDRSGRITENPANEDIESDRISASSDYLVEYAWRTGNLALRELADHAPINYVSAVMADASQPKLARWKFAAKGAASN